jgi:hypothetical protein
MTRERRRVGMGKRIICGQPFHRHMRLASDNQFERPVYRLGGQMRGWFE